ncbi:hypothetical protein SAMN05444279_103149 [Ruegeria intermedia]|uniref:Uncharacterized protein n=2 Tax=Ruegeria intermedia TaxID=996115 RepID=A0A1M4U381_9RHOB|nr:hypothetical protein SAMN05444279_103149 [Ruegeria intermedia]
MLPRKRAADPAARKTANVAVPRNAPIKSKRRKKKKSLLSRVLDEAWDVIEDVFD